MEVLALTISSKRLRCVQIVLKMFFLEFVTIREKSVLLLIIILNGTSVFHAPSFLTQEQCKRMKALLASAESESILVNCHIAQKLYY